MSTGRIVWITFCLGWAVFWITLGWFFVPLLNVIFAGCAAASCLIPIGKQPPPGRDQSSIR